MSEETLSSIRSERNIIVYINNSFEQGQSHGCPIKLDFDYLLQHVLKLFVGDDSL